ncbi:MAG TPA: hypothetical protein P5548_01930 [Candidatus Moranbacteria bacterium]|nr:hypothetical protein [Candidatus Moranbacteria bacterium]HRZ33635.1 hypothetical protein [Candidatus Moranbacteria bacterium]
MKKLIFAVVFASIFFISSLVLAEDTTNEGSLAEAWIAINALKMQVAELQTKQNIEKNPDYSDVVSGNFVKVSEDTSVSKNHRNVPQSEHYVMGNLMIQ